MTEKQPSKESIRKKTLTLLVHQTGLQPEEIATLRLSDLQLAGKTPNVRKSGGSTVELDLDTHRALVGWLVARPDSVSDSLFIGDDLEGMSSEDIKDAIDDASLIDLNLSPASGAASNRSGAPPIKPPTTPPSALDDTLVGSPKPYMPPQSRPEVPRSAPERGPLPGVPPLAGRPFSPPPTAPEMDNPLAAGVSSSSEPLAPPELPPPPESEPEPLPFSRPAGLKKSRVPPKPIRKRDDGPDPVLVQQEPEPPPLPVRDVPEPVEPLPAAPEIKPDQPLQNTPSEAAIASVAAAATISGARPLPVRFDTATAKTSSPPVVPLARGADPVKSTSQAVSTPPVVPSGRSPSDPAANPEYWKSRATHANPPIASGAGRHKSRREYMPFVIGAVVVVVLFCVACVGVSSWFATPAGDAGGLLAGLGLADAPAENTPTPTQSEIVAVATTAPTPTLPPTSTPTALPPTNTPPPTDTPTPESTDEPTPPATNTPEPTATEEPTETPTPEPPAATPTPAEPPTPATPPTPAMKYAAPTLIGPDDDTFFSGVNEIMLQWEPVADLGPDEQYAVRIVYPYNGQETWGGAQVKEPRWVVPLQLMGKIDPPENRYTWFVVVERLNSDGSGTAISPESARSTFVWR